MRIGSLRLAAAGTNKAHQGTDHQRIAKLDRENEVAPPPRVPPTVGKSIGQGRQAKGLTQKELGTKINEKPNVIAEYESGKAIPNPQILAKMERVLGVKLRGTYGSMLLTLKARILAHLYVAIIVYMSANNQLGGPKK